MIFNRRPESRNIVQLTVDLFLLIPSMTDWPMITSTSLKMSTNVTSQSLNYPIARTVSDWDFASSDAHSANSVNISSEQHFLNVSVRESFD